MVIPVPDKSAKTTAKAIFEYFVLTYGPMKTFITDQGTEYKNALMEDLCKYLKVDKLTSTAHHHQTVGTVERSHRTLNEYIRSYISVKIDDWDIWLRYFQYCFNTTPSTVHQYCPYELVFGRTPRQIVNSGKLDKIDPLYNIEDYAKETKYRLEIAYKRARLMLDKAKERQKMLYDKKVNDFTIKVGNLVLLKNEVGHKLQNKYLGPYTVVEIKDRDNIKIESNTGKTQIVYKDRLKITHS